MKKNKIAQYCCIALVAVGFGLNIQNAIENYGLGEDSHSLVADGDSSTGSDSSSGPDGSNGDSSNNPDTSNPDSNGSNNQGSTVKFSCAREKCKEEKTEETKVSEHKPGIDWFLKYEYNNTKTWARTITYTYYKGTCIPGGNGTLTIDDCNEYCPSDKECSEKN